MNLLERMEQSGTKSHETPSAFISIVVPAYNEEQSIETFHSSLSGVLTEIPYTYEIIYINDGSRDLTQEKIESIANRDAKVRFIEFSRNFGKEEATSAGLHHCRGDAAISLDADLQHPPILIPKFIEKWQKKADIVVGVRKTSVSDSLVKRVGSKIFYYIIHRISDTPPTPHATDFRLLDRKVINEFNRLTERNRITRGLIDWLGFKRDFVYFEADNRIAGNASYSLNKLIKLAINSVISLRLLPLRIAGHLGAIITVLAGILGVVMLFDRFVFDQELLFSGTANLATVILFLVGIILMSIGLLAFYIGNIFQETQGRPMYIIRETNITRER